MANHANAKKAHRQSLKRAERNKSRMSRIKTMIKRVLASVASGSKKEAEENFQVAQSEIMKGVKKNILKKNTASRKVSKLSHKLKTLEEKKK